MLQNNSNYCSIIIDAMGGDFAPDEIIKGSIEAKEAYNVKITLEMCIRDRNRHRNT